jgi:hypothetical protein
MTLEVRSATVDVVIAEDALHRQVGGQEVMDKQLNRVLEIADPRVYPWVTLKIMPKASGPSPLCDSGGLSMLRFKALPRLGAAYVEGPNGGRYLQDQDEVTVYAEAFHENSAGRTATHCVPAPAGGNGSTRRLVSPSLSTRRFPERSDQGPGERPGART